MKDGFVEKLGEKGFCPKSEGYSVSIPKKVFVEYKYSRRTVLHYFLPEDRIHDFVSTSSSYGDSNTLIIKATVTLSKLKMGGMMVDINIQELVMDIHLTDSDISQMPEPARTCFLNWLPQYLNAKGFKSNPVPTSQPARQLELLASQSVSHQTSIEKPEHSHVRLTQLFDAGITKLGMLVRVRLKRDLAQKQGRDYINSMTISASGTIIYEEQEFDKPSPLAAKVNGGSVNGWEYIQVKKNGVWIGLDELRTIWRNNHD